MATYKSDQIAKWEATPASKVNPSEYSAEVRVARFSFDNTGGTSLSASDVVRLTQLPENARVLRGRIDVTTTFATDANIQVGVSGTADKYSDTIDADSTGQTDFAHSASNNGMLSSITGDNGEEIIATFDTAGGNGAFEGYIEYVQV